MKIKNLTLDLLDIPLSTSRNIIGRKRPLGRRQMDAAQAKRDREFNFPVKMAILSSKYHSEAEQLTLDDMKALSRYLEIELENFRKTEQQIAVEFSSDTRVQAGMVIIDCKDIGSAKWLKVAVDAIPDQAQGLLGRNIGLKCTKISTAKQHKTFLLVNTNNLDSWDMTVEKMANLGYDTLRWVHLNTRLDRYTTNIFMDTGDTYKKLLGNSRQVVHKSPMNAYTITLKWLRGEDETGNTHLDYFHLTKFYPLYFKASAVLKHSKCRNSRRTRQRTKLTMQPRCSKWNWNKGRGSHDAIELCKPELGLNYLIGITNPATCLHGKTPFELIIKNSSGTVMYKRNKVRNNATRNKAQHYVLAAGKKTKSVNNVGNADATLGSDSGTLITSCCIRAKQMEIKINMESKLGSYQWIVSQRKYAKVHENMTAHSPVDMSKAAVKKCLWKKITIIMHAQRNLNGS